MTNIGHNPTLNEQEKPRLEVHILDFNEEIYGEEIEISNDNGATKRNRKSKEKTKIKT